MNNRKIADVADVQVMTFFVFLMASDGNPKPLN